MTEGSDRRIEFLASFADLDDPRQQAQVLYPLESRRELLAEGKVQEEARNYLSSLPGDAQQIGQAVRSHWDVMACIG